MRLVLLHDPLPPGVDIHRVELSLDVEDECAWRMLAPDEQVRARRFALRADRARFVQTRAAVRSLLARRLGCSAAGVPLSGGPYGKPCVAGDAQSLPLFNVSHAGAQALIALADPARVTHVGIDIEAQFLDLGADIDAILAMAFTERECREVRGAKDAVRAFYQRWVGKEAVLKAVGVGMAEYLQCVGVHPNASGRLDIVCAISEWRGVEAMALPAPPGYAAALAWKTKEPK